jgi:hypothetical protein
VVRRLLLFPALADGFGRLRLGDHDMPDRVTLKRQSLAECETYWNAQGALSAAQKRSREKEREFRTACAAQGIPPNPSIIAKIRSGEFERQAKQAKQRNQEHLDYLARLRREGYSFDAEHRLVAPALTRIHAPERRENVARPRERRPTARQRARAPSGDDPSPESDPPLRVIPLATFRRVLRHALGEQV